MKMKKSGFIKYLLVSSMIAVILFTGSIITLFVYDMSRIPSIVQQTMQRLDELTGGWIPDWNDSDEVFHSNLVFELTDNGQDYYYQQGYQLIEGQNVLLEMDLVNADVTIETTEESNVTVEILTKSPDRYRIEQTPSQLQITEKKKVQLFCLFGCDQYPKSTIVIKVPSNVSQLELETVSGDFMIKHNSDLIEAHTINGGVSLIDSTANEIDFEAINGKIKVTRSQVFNEANLEVVNGSILLTEVESGNLYLETVNGDMTLTELKGGIIDCQTINGDIILKNAYVRDIAIEKLNGHFELLNDDQVYEIQSLKLSGLKKNYEIQAKVRNISYN